MPEQLSFNQPKTKNSSRCLTGQKKVKLKVNYSGGSKATVHLTAAVQGVRGCIRLVNVPQVEIITVLSPSPS